MSSPVHQIAHHIVLKQIRLHCIVLTSSIFQGLTIRAPRMTRAELMNSLTIETPSNKVRTNMIKSGAYRRCVRGWRNCGYRISWHWAVQSSIIHCKTPQYPAFPWNEVPCNTRQRKPSASQNMHITVLWNPLQYQMSLHTWWQWWRTHLGLPALPLRCGVRRRKKRGAFRRDTSQEWTPWAVCSSHL